MQRSLCLLGIVVFFLFPVITGCQHETNPAKYFSRTPDRSSERTLWVEEVRNPRGRVVGYLEKVKYQPAGQPYPRNMYFVYGPGFGKVPVGSITDTGWAYRYRQGGKKKDDLGPIGITEGVKEILNRPEEVRFFRSGTRKYH